MLPDTILIPINGKLSTIEISYVLSSLQTSQLFNYWKFS